MSRYIHPIANSSKGMAQGPLFVMLSLHQWRRLPSRLLLLTPAVKRFLPTRRRAPASFRHETPCPRTNNFLHAALCSDNIGEGLGSRFPGEEPSRIWVQSFVHHSLSVLRRFGFSEDEIGVVRIRTCGHTRTVVEHIGAGLPRRK